MNLKATILLPLISSCTLLLADDSPIIPEGKVAAGKTLFVEKGCYQCHFAGEITVPQSELSEDLFIDLGGEDHTSWSRDDYAKSILNPNHAVSEEYRKVMITLGANYKAENSPMPSFNDILTVSDLIHITTFLESLK